MQNEEALEDQENLKTKGGHDTQSTFDLQVQKATNSSNHSTTIASKERPITKDNEQFPRDESSPNAENEDCQPERWCHTTFANDYQTSKEEECKETFSR